MSNSDENIFKSLVKGGIIGAALGAIISKDTEEGALIGGIAGAAILATYQASQETQANNLSVMVEEDGAIFEKFPNGEKKLIKKIQKQNIKVRKKFKLQ